MTRAHHEYVQDMLARRLSPKLTVQAVKQVDGNAAVTIKLGQQILGIYQVTQTMTVRRFVLGMARVTSDAVKLQELVDLDLDLEQRVSNLVAMLTERGST